MLIRGVYSLHSRSDSDIQQLVAAQPMLNYTPQGMSETLTSPPGYRTNQYTTTLGSGRRVFEQAKDYLKNFRHIELDWVKYQTSGSQIEEGLYTASLSRFLGIWVVVLTQITKIIDEPTRYGYIMGTTPHHVLRGEEMFLIQLVDDSVIFTIYSYSKPHGLISTLGQIVLRYLQRKFVRTVSARLYELLTQE